MKVIETEPNDKRVVIRKGSCSILEKLQRSSVNNKYEQGDCYTCKDKTSNTISRRNSSAISNIEVKEVKSLNFNQEEIKINTSLIFSHLQAAPIFQSFKNKDSQYIKSTKSSETSSSYSIENQDYLGYKQQEYKIGVFIENKSDNSNSNDASPLTSKNKHISPLMVILPNQKLNLDNSNYISDFNLQINNDDNEEEKTPSANTKLSIKDFNIIKLIGSGAYAQVCLCCKKDSFSQKYALKIVDKKLALKNDKIKDFIKEREILSNFKSNHIIRLKASFQNKFKFYFLLEYAEKGDMSHYLGNSTLDLNTAIYFIANIINCVEYLHKNNYSHRDLKLDNLVIDHNMKVKLIDFNCALKLDNISSSNIYNNDLVGTLEYTPPEIINKTCNNPFKIDAWAVGIIFYKFLHGKFPFESYDSSLTIEKIRNYQGFSSLYVNKEINSIALDFIEKLLNKDQNSRLGCLSNNRFDISILKSHLLFKNVNFQNLQFEGIGLNSKFI